MRKIQLATAFLLCLPLMSWSQVMQIKKKVLYADGAQVMTITRHGLGSATHFQCLDHGKDVLCVAWDQNGTAGVRTDDCLKIEFLGKKLVMYTTMSIDTKEWPGLMRREGALKENWEVDEDGARAFIEKYGEPKPIPAYGKRRRKKLQEQEGS